MKFCILSPRVFQNASESVHHGWRKFCLLYTQNISKCNSTGPPQLEKFLHFYHQNVPKCISISPPQLEKFLHFVHLEYSKMQLNQSIMVGENFAFSTTRMFQNAFQSVHYGYKKLCISLPQDDPNCILISPPWLEKFLPFVCLEYLKMQRNRPTIVGKIFAFLPLE